jgi:hypothetical protein
MFYLHLDAYRFLIMNACVFIYIKHRKMQQLLVVQLPPVPKRYINDEGEYSFISKLLDIIFPNRIQLMKHVTF